MAVLTFSGYKWTGKHIDKLTIVEEEIPERELSNPQIAVATDPGTREDLLIFLSFLYTRYFKCNNRHGIETLLYTLTKMILLTLSIDFLKYLFNFSCWKTLE